MSRSSDLELKIECPACKRKIKKRLSQLGHNRLFKCSCGQNIQMKGNGASNARKSLERLNRTFSRLGGR